MFRFCSLFVVFSALCAEVFSEETAVDVLAPWTQRQNTVRALHFTWSARHTCAVGTIRPAVLSPTGEPEPKEEFSYTDPEVSLWVDGIKMRYEHDQADYAARMAGGNGSRYTSTFDGDVSADFTSAGSDEFARGIICEEAKYNDFGNYHFLPLLLWCRPLHPGLLDPDTLQFVESAVRVEKRENLVLVTVSGPDGADPNAHLWVDTARGYTITRYTALDRGKPTIDLEITCADDPVHGWIPSEWTVRTLSRNGSILTSVQAKVLSYTINHSIPSEMFRLVFPPDTLVADRRAKEDYLVMHDGSRRVITKAERMSQFTLDELKTTRSGELFGLRERNPSWRSKILYPNFALFVILLGWFVFRHYRHRLSE